MNSTRQTRLVIYVFSAVILFFQCASGMERKTSSQVFVEKYKQDYTETSLESLNAGLLLLGSGICFAHEELLVKDLVEQAKELHRRDPNDVEKLIWSHYNRLSLHARALLEQWVERQRRCYYCKMSTIGLAILGTIIFSCTNVTAYLLAYPELNNTL